MLVMYGHLNASGISMWEYKLHHYCISYNFYNYYRFEFLFCDGTVLT